MYQIRILTLLSFSIVVGDEDRDAEGPSLHQVEGKVYPPDPKPENWLWETRILVDGGKRQAFIREDNTFIVYGLSAGSHLLEVSNPDYMFEPVRVDINAKGRTRARKVNNVQPTQVDQVTYPLRLKHLGTHRFFRKREEWRATDIFRNPMIWMMALSLIFVSFLPKMMNDPETKRELEQIQQTMNVQNHVPEFRRSWLIYSEERRQR